VSETAAVPFTIINGTSAQLGYKQCHSRWFMLENTGQKTK